MFSSEFLHAPLSKRANFNMESFLGALPIPEPGFNLLEFLKKVKNALIWDALEASGDNYSEASKRLGISRQAIWEFVSKSPQLKLRFPQV
jgi:transcriptional regulator with PAS, ATPase and Fis domain